MANVLFIGDIHGGHKNICNFRPQFNSEKEHLEFIKHCYHTKVTKRDKVFFMGDIAFSFEALQEISTWEGKQKILICGNHDLDRIGMKTVSQYYDEVYSLLKYKEFWLSHCPIHPDELRGKLSLHGHTHIHNIDDPRYFNTSCENINYTPISLHEIREIMSIKNERT